MSKCLWSGWKWYWGVNEIPSPFPCSPVISECSWKKTHIEKKNKKQKKTKKKQESDENDVSFYTMFVSHTKKCFPEYKPTKKTECAYFWGLQYWFIFTYGYVHS